MPVIVIRGFFSRMEQAEAYNQEIAEFATRVLRV